MQTRVANAGSPDEMLIAGFAARPGVAVNRHLLAVDAPTRLMCAEAAKDMIGISPHRKQDLVKPTEFVQVGWPSGFIGRLREI